MLALRNACLKLVGVACGLALTSVCAPTAWADAPADGGKAFVVLGDSYTSNGVIDDLVNAVVDQYTPPKYRPCHPEPSSWPNKLADKLRLSQTNDVTNESCIGATLTTGTGYTAVAETRLAVKAAAFGPRTTLVAIQLGYNDTWDASNKRFNDVEPCLLDLIHGCGTEVIKQGRATDPATVTGAEYAKRVGPVVDYIRYYAPHARIVFVGYPELHDQGTQALCFNALGATFAQPRAGAWTTYTDALEHAQRDAAAALKVDFFDAAEVTRGHGTCSPDPWVNGVLNPKTGLRGMLWHPTEQGDSAVAAGLQRQLASTPAPQ